MGAHSSSHQQRTPLLGSRCARRRRWRDPRLVFLSAILVFGGLSYLQTPPPLTGCGTEGPRHGQGLEHMGRLSWSSRSLLNSPKTNESENNETVKRAQFPEDLFSEEQRKRGAVILHVMGMVYMFVALAIVCDEFFIPALDVITVKLDISEDVAGATFMAAGGSAPELFTSVIGVFISFDDVGIGTIVGSAVFNILFVISMCAIFSKSVLQLTWWPLFRDVSFYSVILIILMHFFRDSIIYWWEALVLLLCYASYVTFMKFNEGVEKMLKKLLNRNKVTRVGSTDHLMPHAVKRKQSAASELRALRRMQSVVLEGTAPASGEDGQALPPLSAAVATGEGPLAPPAPDSALEPDNGVEDDDSVYQPPSPPPMARRRMSAPILHSGSKFRHGLLQLLIHSIDPLHEHEGEANAKLDEKASQLHTIASLRVLLDATKPGGEGQSSSGVANGGPPPAPLGGCPRGGTQDGSSGSAETRLTSLSNSDALVRVDSVSNLQSDSSITSNLSEKMAAASGGGVAILHQRPAPIQESIESPSLPATGDAIASALPDSGYNSATAAQAVQAAKELPPDTIEETNEPLSVAWPDTWRERFNYVVLAPIIFPLWLTMPDVRRPEKVKFVAGSFLGSIAWIAIFSYLMVWWATVVGETLGIPTEVMGLTFLAAGTSIPDLITSVLVARKGFGDMAVSSSVGSNIFDVAVGLPLPWLLSCMIYGPVKVSSSGMACSIFILFMMLLFVIITIALFRWRMNVGLAMVMFFLYFVFIACSLILEYEVVRCTDIINYLRLR
ncbi:sodium/potassium/calcium exchanger 2 [Rhipicephalus sanguineus]|uniref:sodium/potassium/calcium exchanger 2 n=1 Tax=Rhipicephalus sanguineus TaxID=34632 RepID=UPI0020C45040|nr:sodium/potassium/calcium exchanger 2 [Rhipicephalus sanguineus]